ncbi:hypothetical protein OS493_022228 [Desmophyllum pertusum]|uniref:SAM domain-containing protein n=1 Tax=Desmophyllum pertusum TaxID=174260 RepID=A0A9W9YCI4_9CNID|nr:hypothetical protein OS493_022228 [Desmophyllum pertusum]
MKLIEETLCSLSGKHSMIPPQWTVEDVQKWLNVKGFKEECELFRAENICGKALRAIERADLKEMGVKTMGRRILLIDEIQALLGSSCNHTG